MMEGKMMERCQAMMAEMKAQDAALAELVVQMNGAPEDKKLGQLAAVVTRMVEQRVAMNAHMKMMMEEMMKSMPMGKNPGSPEPMMKGMDESTGEHPKSAS